MTVIRSSLGRAFRLVSDTRGATAAVLAVSMATLIGFAGLGVETGLWFSEKRHYQTATDAAAISGAFQVAAQIPNSCSTAGGTNPNQPPILKAGTTMATANGYNGPLAVAGSSVATTEKLYINNPPTSGAYAGNWCAVEAILYEPKNSLLAAVYKPNVTIGTRAVALVKLNYGGGACNLTLNASPNAPSGAGGIAGIYMGGTATINEPGCMMASNSPSASSTPCKGDSQGANGNPTVTVAGIYAVGGDCLGSNVSLPNNGLVPVTGGAPIPDPFASTFPNNPSMPSGSNCPGTTEVKNPSNTTIQPGTYKDVQLTSGGPYTLASGTYYICGSGNGAGVGAFSSSVELNTASGGATLIVQGQINITGTGTMQAPQTSSTATPYPGVLIYQPGDSSNLQADTINGGSDLHLQGAFYLPGGNLTFNGNDNVTALTADQKCLVIVSYTLQFTGTAEIDQSNNCSNDPIPKINITNVVMAE